MPLALQNELLQAYHNSPLGAHQGFDRTYQRLKQKYWWPSMAKDVKTYIQCCDTCQRTKCQYHISKTPLQPLPTTERFQRIHMDFLGPLPTTTQGHKHILLIVDAFTKWPEAFPLKSAQASDVARIFYDKIICRYGAPSSILTDQGSYNVCVPTPMSSRTTGMSTSKVLCCHTDLPQQPSPHSIHPIC